MVLEEVFSTNLISSAKIISRDSKIYEAFKPSLLNVEGITLSEFMSDKEMRKNYRQKYGEIKLKLQQQNPKKKVISDDECLTKISLGAKEWEEFVVTARDNTMDGGKSFIRNMPLEKFVIMTPKEKYELENQLINDAIKRVRSYTSEMDKKSSEELEAMLSSEPTTTKDISQKK